MPQAKQKVLGESFPDYVRDQVAVRQEKLGSSNYNTGVRSWLTGAGPWIRMVSSVDADQSRLDEHEIDSEPGNKLATNNLLFGGKLYENDYQNTGGGYGVLPRPRIESATITPKNRGSLRDATIRIKCFDRNQLDIIETLYMRLGYSILLEWGHTMYFGNDKEVVKSPRNSVYKSFLDLPTPTDEDDVNSNYLQLLKLVEAEREESSGNYDGFVGKIKNFTWSLTSEMHYDVVIEAVSVGDIIESLSITNPYGDKSSDDNTDERDNQITSPFARLLKDFKAVLKKGYNDAGSNDRALGNVRHNDFSNLRSTPIYVKEYAHGMFKPTGGNSTSEGVKFGSYGVWVSWMDGKDLTNNIIKQIGGLEMDPYLAPGEEDSGTEYRGDREILTVHELHDGNGPDESFIKLGLILRLIQNFFYKYNTDEADNPPLQFFDYNYRKNYCNILPTLTSSSLMQVMFPSKLKFWAAFKNPSWFLFADNEHNKWYYAWERPAPNGWVEKNYVFQNRWMGGGDSGQNCKFFVDGDDTLGHTMDIYVNIDHLINLIARNTDSEGNLSIFDLIELILDTIRRNSVGIIDLGLEFDEFTNTYYIRNQSALTSREKQHELYDVEVVPPVKLQVGRVKANTGSFVKNVAIQSQITPRMATQITIGAQAGGKSVGANSAMFSAWNAGLTDRVFPVKSSAMSGDKTEYDLTEELFSNKPTRSESLRAIDKVLSFTAWIGNFKGYREDFEDAYHSANLTLNRMRREYEHYSNGNPEIGKVFIPISLTIDMVGMSGMKIYNQYSINDEILPKSYQDSVDFIVKGLTHTIDSEGWHTKIEGLSIPRGTFNESDD